MSSILVVDDSLTVRMDLAEALEEAGLHPVPCATLTDARRELDAQPIALVLLDVRLPDGDGVAFLEELRADPRTALLPILMLSSEADVKDRIRGLATGATDYIGKPYDVTRVIARIRQLVVKDRRDVVLVIDDSITFRSELGDRLAASGYDTVLAGDGVEGLRAAARHLPAAIIVDGVMPKLEGTAVIRRIRLDPALRTIPCLMLTGSTDAQTEVQALEAGADAFVRKEDGLDVILARVAAMLRTSARSHLEVPAAPEHPRVLAVDDSPTYLQAVADHLRDDGFDVVMASSGEEAIDLLAVQPVDCILLDRVMPGMSGAEACHRIKSAPRVRDTPLIMVTALEGSDAMIDGLTAGADDFISKSSGLEVLKARVHAQIRRKLIEDEHRSVREHLLRSELEARAARELADTRSAMADALARANAQLRGANRELEAFSYSISHDLRAPLRAIAGFSGALVEGLNDKLDDDARGLFDRILGATKRMDVLIGALIELAKITHSELSPRTIDLSRLCSQITDELASASPERRVTVVIAPHITVHADLAMMRLLFGHLIDNAWKFSMHTDNAQIEIGVDTSGPERVFFIRDNGAGFDSTSSEQLFNPFQRMHNARDFIGPGIGLATVRRIIERHGGRVWAESAPDRGATFYFTLVEAPDH